MKFLIFYIVSSLYNQLVIFDVIIFPLAPFVLFRDLSCKNLWLNHTTPLEKILIVVKSVKKDFLISTTWPGTCKNIRGKTFWLRGVWKKIFPFRPLDHAHANAQWRKKLLLPGVWNNNFPVHQLDHAHANTHWRKNLLLPNVRIKIFPVQCPCLSHAHTCWRKTFFLLEMWKKSTRSHHLTRHIRTHTGEKP